VGLGLRLELGWRFRRATIAVCLLLLSLSFVACRKNAESDEFTRLSNLGKSALEKGDATRAIEVFDRALKLAPASPDARLNLANALLLANQPDNAIRQAEAVLAVDPNSAAAHYIIGCANLRLDRAEAALKALQQSQKIDQAVTAVNFQLALAHERLGHLDEALLQLQTVVEFEPDHGAAHYRMSQILQRLGRADEAAQGLQKHRDILNKKPPQTADVATFERSKHTQARLPFKLEQPLPAGIRVSFSDITSSAISNASAYHGPIAVIDPAHDGRNGLLVGEGEGFRLLLNTGGAFTRQEKALPGNPGARYRQALVADLQNDRYEDVLVLGEQTTHLFRFATNAVVTEATRFAGLSNLTAIDGALLDFDFTGKLGLLALQTNGAVRVFRNLGNLYFSENSVTSGLPAAVAGARHLVLEDLNNDDLIDVLITREREPPLAFVKQRGGPFIATNLGAALPAVPVITTGDLNNDSRPDIIAAAKGNIEILFGGSDNKVVLPAADFRATSLTLFDYDNDGWLDILAAGGGLRVWRNLGNAGFRETTRELGLDTTIRGTVESVGVADFDGDCDTDLALALEGGGLKLLRNDGGNANQQLKLRLVGNRSNSSALGIRLELSAGGLRAWRTINRLPVELGVGKHGTVDSVAVRWFDGLLNNDEIKLDQCMVLALEELQLPTGSCPYLFAWDGQRFRFVTDLLGASPLGLRVTETRFVEADPEEFVWIGDERGFPPRDGNYVLQVTEELREVLYLDEAKLVVVDHPANTEVYTTGKLRPGKPFPSHEFITLHNRHPLRGAVNHEAQDVTALLADADARLVSPTKLRIPQLRGLSEPHRVTLDFGPLDATRPLVLALTGWLRFGGGMANVAASHNPDLPFPFPTLDVETSGGQWQPVNVVVGAPAGKTKSIVVDLTGKLPPGSQRLRLSTAFELHWDRIALFEKRDNTETRMTLLPSTKADLHWRGYSEFEDFPRFVPLTPNYAKVASTANWIITPSGWCTRYGSVDELIGSRDNALALLNGGDELTLRFAANRIPPKPAGAERDFFFYSIGWDKDADFHCELGSQVEPLPWHGMEDQHYGRQPRPAFENDDWMKRYNTRWVGPYTLTKRDRR
jgi:tetratricopeptide (TPR) repeat protein